MESAYNGALQERLSYALICNAIDLIVRGERILLPISEAEQNRGMIHKRDTSPGKARKGDCVCVRVRRQEPATKPSQKHTDWAMREGGNNNGHQRVAEHLQFFNLKSKK